MTSAASSLATRIRARTTRRPRLPRAREHHDPSREEGTPVRLEQALARMEDGVIRTLFAGTEDPVGEAESKPPATALN